MWRIVVLAGLLIMSPMGAFAKDYETALSDFTGQLHVLTNQLKADVDLVMPHIRGFDEVYDATTNSKIYQGTRIQWETIGISSNLIWTPPYQQELVSGIEYIMNQVQNQTIRDIIEKYTWYVSDRYIDNYGDCSRQNFMRAFDEFGTIILQPGQTFNVNKLLAGLDGYCTGSGREYMFYQGVCGFSTQVWRNALINPYLETVKRAGHGNWWQAYYGEEIVGDDAAIYEMDKQLIIGNASDLPIYMRTLEVDGKKYLLSVVPEVATTTIELTRENIGRLQGRVVRTIQDKQSGEIIQKNHYTTQYRSVIVGSN